MNFPRQHGDVVAHSFGLTDVPVLQTRRLRESQLVASRLAIGPSQLGMTPKIPPEDTFIVAMYLTEVPRHELWSRGRCVLRQGYVPSSIRIVNLSEEYSACVSSPHESLILYVPRIALNEFTDEAGEPRVLDFACPPGHVDPVMTHLAAALLPAFRQPGNNLFTEHLTLAMLTHLCSRYGGALKDPPFRKGAGMTRLQAQRAKEFLASRCDDDVPLVEVARACGLSRGHFTKAFRVTTGLTPHQWLQRYRVDKAKRLLLDPATPIAEIAAACGFADQSHLTRVFSRLVGTPPAAWRRGR